MPNAQQLFFSERIIRAAGSGGRDLTDTFIREIAKEQQIKNAPKHQGCREPAAQPEQPNLPGV